MRIVIEKKLTLKRHAFPSRRKQRFKSPADVPALQILFFPSSKSCSAAVPQGLFGPGGHPTRAAVLRPSDQALHDLADRDFGPLLAVGLAESEHLPTVPAQPSIHLDVPFHIPFDFRPPKWIHLRREALVVAAMPKIAV